MRKIQLDLDTLQVDSFPTTPKDGAPRGTAHGAQWSQLFCSEAPGSCVGDPTCMGAATCTGVCSATDGIVACKTCGALCGA